MYCFEVIGGTQPDIYGNRMEYDKSRNVFLPQRLVREKRAVLGKQAIYKVGRHLLAIKKLSLSVLIPVPTILISSSIILIVLIHLFCTA